MEPPPDPHADATPPDALGVLSTLAPTLVDAIAPDLDPHLQRVMVRRRLGGVEPAGATTGTDEVAVLARVSDAEAWEALSEVRVGARIAVGPDDFVVTGRIPAARIHAVRSHPFVRSLKASRPVRPALHATVRELEAAPEALPPEALAAGGAGVVIGVVDYGCDVAHASVRRADGRTRLLAVWDQHGPRTPSSPYGYGRAYTADEIDTALQAQDPYTALGYGPAYDSSRQKGTHGAHVVDIAAGSAPGRPGLAPEAEIVFVDFAGDDIAWEGQEATDVSLGDSVQLLEAVQYVFEVAGDRPCVVNLSLGTNGGPHDGTTALERGVDALVRARPNRAVVIAAANSYDDHIHAAGVVPAGASIDLPVSASLRRTHTEVEVWTDAATPLDVDLLAPNGETLLTVAAGGRDALVDDDDRALVFLSSRLDDDDNGDNVVALYLEGRAELPDGTWTLRLRRAATADPGADGSFHAWIERNNRSRSAFAGPPYDDTHTLGSLSCGHESIVVGSYDAHKPGLPLSWFSSAGPTRDGRLKPEVSAPGHDVVAAHSRTGDRGVQKSGTSMAAPAVAGVVALVLAEAHRRGLDLTAAEVREIVIGSARRSPPGGDAWHDRYGYGRPSAAAAVAEVVRRAGAA